jgi:hypothetical protein
VGLPGLDPVAQVLGRDVNDQLRQGNHPATRFGLGLGHQATATFECHQLFHDGEAVGLEIDVISAQGDEFSDAEPGEAGDEGHRRAIACRWHSQAR